MTMSEEPKDKPKTHTGLPEAVDKRIVDDVDTAFDGMREEGMLDERTKYNIFDATQSKRWDALIALSEEPSNIELRKALSTAMGANLDEFSAYMEAVAANPTHYQEPGTRLEAYSMPFINEHLRYLKSKGTQLTTIELYEYTNGLEFEIQRICNRYGWDKTTTVEKQLYYFFASKLKESIPPDPAAATIELHNTRLGRLRKAASAAVKLVHGR